MVKRYKKQNIGTVSHGTMRAEDLIPSFIWELEHQTPTKRAHLKLIREIESRMNPGKPTGKQCMCIHRQGEHDNGECLICECPQFVVRSNQAGETYDERENEYWTDGDADSDLEELFDALDEYAPPYFYFGAHPGDGSDYGFWLSESFQEDFDGLKVNGLDEVPRGFTGEVLAVNDHGNMSLYVFSRGRRVRTCWEVV